MTPTSQQPERRSPDTRAGRFARDGRPLLVALRPLGLSDFLTAVPSLRALDAAFPAHQKVIAARRELEPLLSLAGVFDALVDTAPLAELDARLRDADIAVDLQGKGPRSHRVLLSSGARRLIAFRNEEISETENMARWIDDEHEVRRWCRMLEESFPAAGEAPIETDSSDFELTPPLLDIPENSIEATLLHISASSEARRWSAERWTAVARAERARGRPVIITGGPNDRALACWIADQSGISRENVYAGRADLLELAMLVFAAGRVVCGDTGIAHLATALGRASVLLFGPTNPAFWGPPPDRRWHRVLWNATAHDKGLEATRVREVLDAIDEVDAIATARFYEEAVIRS